VVSSLIIPIYTEFPVDKCFREDFQCFSIPCNINQLRLRGSLRPRTAPPVAVERPPVVPPGEDLPPAAVLWPPADCPPDGVVPPAFCPPEDSLPFRPVPSVPQASANNNGPSAKPCRSSMATYYSANCLNGNSGSSCPERARQQSGAGRRHRHLPRPQRRRIHLGPGRPPLSCQRRQ
jgi:hypothetical protein